MTEHAQLVHDAHMMVYAGFAVFMAVMGALVYGASLLITLATVWSWRRRSE